MTSQISLDFFLRSFSFTGLIINIAAIRSKKEKMYLRVLPDIKSDKNPPKKAEIAVRTPIIKNSFHEMLLFFPKKNDADKEEIIRIN